MIKEKKAYFRFYEELNDFLPRQKQKVKFPHSFILRESVKDMIEAIGVPHAEVDLILVNGSSKGFDYIVSDNDEISVYPVFESFDVTDVQHLRPKPLRDPKFIADVHLGNLARYMRMAGFDTLYENTMSSYDMVKLSLSEKRTILTGNRELLKRNDITHGCYIRAHTAERQLREVINRFHLEAEVKPFSRCMLCNNLLEAADKKIISEQLPEKVKLYHDLFYICSGCNKIYWKGSHYVKMQKILAKTGILNNLPII
jgi:uncharacterized protein with PIN domain